MTADRDLTAHSASLGQASLRLTASTSSSVPSTPENRPWSSRPAAQLLGITPVTRRSGSSIRGKTRSTAASRPEVRASPGHLQPASLSRSGRQKTHRLIGLAALRTNSTYATLWDGKPYMLIAPSTTADVAGGVSRVTRRSPSAKPPPRSRSVRPTTTRVAQLNEGGANVSGRQYSEPLLQMLTRWAPVAVAVAATILLISAIVDHQWAQVALGALVLACGPYLLWRSGRRSHISAMATTRWPRERVAAVVGSADSTTVAKVKALRQADPELGLGDATKLVRALDAD